ncbi:lipoyl(octanoyl) transferase LipB [Mariprofundus erugo]|uniref:lipoyl(octanoyl) transferase LipB n=1 Tax=Mariprofundus erugo TaxID=2528639 RepID=UPI0010FD57EC|nr:lipoyl(octanoyl) transferase LipB [Mariprofundus erugo]TLS77601.1 lipoyl(octanoyl) transferase LipB [Mariprofundus erugo]
MHVIFHKQQPYPESVAEQEQMVASVLAGSMPSSLILTEHPPTYTIGTSGHSGDILSRSVDGESIAVYPTGRGGEVTYHGPGQLVCYVIADLKREPDLHRHIWRLEEMVIRTLADFGVVAGRDSRGIGVWVDGLKIAAAGVRCRKWVTFHGIALNNTPNLKHFSGIVPCGMQDQPVTSMQKLGLDIPRARLEQVLIGHCHALFDPLVAAV